MERQSLRVFGNTVVSRVFGPKRDEVKDSGEIYITRSLMIFTSQQILFGW
jgi:hypothetical protein